MDLEYEIKDLTSNLEAFSAACDNIVTACGGETDATTATAIKRGKIEIIKSVLADNFVQKYKHEVRSKDNGDDLITIIKKVICRSTDEEKINFAKKELRKTSRRIHEDEPFVIFVDRLKNWSSKITSDKNFEKYLVEEQFNDNISPSLRQYLLDMDKLELDVESKAMFLDRKGKHKKSLSVNQIVLTESKEILDELEKEMSSENDKLREGIQKLTGTVLRLQVEV